jgi:hypothetical protein
VLLGKLEAKRQSKCAALAGKSTLNRLELHPRVGHDRYHKIRPDGAAIERLFVDMFLEAHTRPPAEIVLDLDATDDPLHGQQEGRFFHGYYGGYCYLPLYIFCGEHLLAARLRPANIDASAGAQQELERIVAQIRARWPTIRIVVRADSGFAREALMGWCEANGVDYLLGLAKNARLVRAIGAELQQAARAAALYEERYCARGEMENHIKEAQLDLFADRLSTATFRANQLRLWLSSAAYVLLHSLRRLALVGTQFERACAGTIRLKLLKIGAVVTLSVRRVKLALSSACPYQPEFMIACHALGVAAR